MPTKIGKEEVKDQLLAFMDKMGVEAETIMNQGGFYSFFLEHIPESKRKRYYSQLKDFPDIADHGGAAYFFGTKKSQTELLAMGKTPWTSKSSGKVKHGFVHTRKKLEEFAEENGINLAEVKNRGEFYEKRFLPSLSDEERSLYHSRIRSIPGCNSDILFGEDKTGKHSQAEVVKLIWLAIDQEIDIRDVVTYRAWLDSLSKDEKDKFYSNPAHSFSVPDFFAQFRRGKEFYSLSEHIDFIERTGIISLDQYRAAIEKENQGNIKKYHFDPEKIFALPMFITDNGGGSEVFGDMLIKFLNAQCQLGRVIEMQKEIGEKLESALSDLNSQQEELNKLRIANKRLQLEALKNAEDSNKWQKKAELNENDAFKYREIKRRVSLRKKFGDDNAKTAKAPKKEIQLLYYSNEFSRVLPSRIAANRNFTCCDEEYFYTEEEINIFISKNGITSEEEYLSLIQKLPEKAQKYYPKDLVSVYGKTFF